MNNYQHKQKTTQIASMLVGSTMVLSGVLSMALQASAYEVRFRQLDKTVEKAYGVDAFEEEYSYGALFKDGAAKVNSSNETSLKTSFSGTSVCESTVQYCGNNTSRNPNIYVTTVRGAFYKNEFLDVREYLWTDKGQWGRAIDSSAIYYNPNAEDEDKNGTVHREFHFYKTGTNTEVNFKGIVAFSDLDWSEGYYIEQGYHQAYLDDPTLLDYSSPNTWLTQNNEEEGLYVNDPHALWVEVDSTSSRPLILAYKAPESRGSGTYVNNVNYIEYNLIGSKPTGVTAPKYDTVVRYGTATPKNPTIANGTNLDDYDFTGWYLDEGLTNKAEEKIRITSNIKLYGKYVKKDSIKISTSALNGTITDSILEIEPGEDYTIEYTCDNGSDPVSVMVDGNYLDVNKYGKSYTFEEATEEHSINVICEKKENEEETEEADSDSSAKVPNTGANGPISFGAGLEDGPNNNSIVPKIILSACTSILGIIIILIASRKHNTVSFKKQNY